VRAADGMTTIAIVQARMGSTRLPGKVLRELAGRPVLSWVVRAATATPGVDGVVVATSTNPLDTAIEDWCVAAGVDCFRGSEADVLDRFAVAAERHDADIVLRLTADCPLLDPAVCGQVLAMLQLTGADYVTNADPRRWPDGLDCEAMRMSALLRARTRADSAFEREHVTPHLRDNRRLFRVESLPCPLPGLGRERWTLDTEADFARLQQLTADLPADRPPSWLEVLRAAGRLASAEPAQMTTASTAGDAGGDRYARSQALFERALKTIPTASQTFSKSHIQFPPGHAPLFVSHGRGGRVWDIDGNRYVDLIAGLLPVILGYCDEDVDAAIARQLDRGISFSLATELEVELAERLVSLIPCAEQVRFAKNGSDATTGAIRVARAFTGRERVAVCGYHGWQDWYIGSTTRDKGIPRAVKELTTRFAFNDLESLDAVLAAHPGEIAAVMLEPMTTERPAPGFLAGVKELAHRHGALLVFDEIVTGFRFHLGGAQALFGVTPDLAAFGKAMANGMPLSAVVGRADVMAEMDEVFFSGTFGGEALSLAAALATLDKLERDNVVDALWRTGADLVSRLEPEIERRGLSPVLRFCGVPAWTLLAFNDHENARAALSKTILRRELLRRGVLIGSSHNVCFAHDAADVDRICWAYGEALDVLAELLTQPDLEAGFNEPIVEPVFAVRSEPA